MNLSQKCQYGLRAMLELAVRGPDEPTSIAEIAKAQTIPPRFLEQILLELTRERLLVSRRGPKGGYSLEVPAEDITLGRLVEFFEGPFKPVKCIAAGEACPMRGDCVFESVWEEVTQAVTGVYNRITLKSLADRERTRRGAAAAINYVI